MLISVSQCVINVIESMVIVPIMLLTAYTSYSSIPHVHHNHRNMHARNGCPK